VSGALLSGRKRLVESVERDFDNTLELVSKLVGEQSVAGSAAIRRCLEIVLEALPPDSSDLKVVEFEGVPNLIARFGNDSDENRLILCGHVDVVAASNGWTTNPFTLIRKGNRLVGRGACDMKAGVAAFVAALRALHVTRQIDDYSIDLVLTGDEETGSAHGAIPLLDDLTVKGRWAVFGEPTQLKVWVGNRGYVWLNIDIQGRGGHSALSHALANPWPAAATIATALHGLDLGVIDRRFSPPTSTVNVTRMQANTEPGGAINVIPDSIRIGVDVRILPGQNADAVRKSISSLAESIVDDELAVKVTAMRSAPAFALDENHELTQAALKSVRYIGRKGITGTDLATNDASWFDATGIASILLGPGNPIEAHAIDESVTIRDLADAAITFAVLPSFLKSTVEGMTRTAT
jgi:acetylornithine deacetylase/succinyl-diaminopimelate desuccinylase-like protein